MATTNDLKNGMVLNLDGQLWQVIWFQHHKPGKGGAVVRTKLKNVESGKTVDKTFNADVKVEVANVDKRTMQYLYNDGTSYVFMDTGTYDQLEITPEHRRRRRRTSCWRTRRRSSPPTRAASSTSSCRPRSSSRSPTPSPASPATAPPAAPSRPRSRPATRSRSRCSSPRARRSRSTPATRRTSAASSPDARCPPGPRPASARSTCCSPPSCAARTRSRRSTARSPTARARPTTTPPSWCAASPSTRPRIDELLAEYSEGWTLDRMPAVDRNVLRLGVFELLYADDVPDAVAVTEAMALVRDLSTDESPGVRQRRPRQHPAQQGHSADREAAAAGHGPGCDSPMDRRSPTRRSAPAATHSRATGSTTRSGSGLVAYGVVHLLIAWLALQLAFGEQRSTRPATAPCSSSPTQPFGDGPDLAGRDRHVPARRSGGCSRRLSAHQDEDGAKRVAKRLRLAAQGASSTARSASARCRSRSGSGSSGKSGSDSITAKLMDLPGGQLDRRRRRARHHRLRLTRS